ncbi:TPA: hypothetical protein HPU08_002876 [Listeria monocytogenes]|nr:hypothetical protein [Listeria monocytogenes]
MGQIDIMIVLFFSALILLNLKEMTSLIIPTKKRKKDILIVTIISLTILALTFWYGRILSHYLFGILLIIVMNLFWIKRGITQKGFNSIMSLSYFQRWDNIDYVEVNLNNNDDLKLSYLTSHLLGKESYYFKKEDYDKIINVLSESLSKEKIKINQV